jgi:hypothetical protein
VEARARPGRAGPMMLWKGPEARRGWRRASNLNGRVTHVHNDVSARTLAVEPLQHWQCSGLSSRWLVCITVRSTRQLRNRLIMCMLGSCPIPCLSLALSGFRFFGFSVHPCITVEARPVVRPGWPVHASGSRGSRLAYRNAHTHIWATETRSSALSDRLGSAIRVRTPAQACRGRLVTLSSDSVPSDNSTVSVVEPWALRASRPPSRSRRRGRP